MPTRSLDVGGEKWEVYPSGHITQYTQDEYGLIFSRGADKKRELRVIDPSAALIANCAETVQIGGIDTPIARPPQRTVFHP